MLYDRIMIEFLNYSSILKEINSSAPIVQLLTRNQENNTICTFRGQGRCTTFTTFGELYLVYSRKIKFNFEIIYSPFISGNLRVPLSFLCQSDCTVSVLVDFFH